MAAQTTGSVEGTRPTVVVVSLTGCGGDRIILHGLQDALTRIADIRWRDTGDQADIALVEGAVASERDAERLRSVRERSTTLVALGTCATYGGVPATVPTRPLHDIVAVDAAVPGCAVEAREVLEALGHLLRGNPPLPRPYPVCTECRLRETQCVLVDVDGICLGSLTAAGCGAPCPAVGIGCVGCRGPAPDANWSSALRLFMDRGHERADLVRKMGTFARTPAEVMRVVRGA